tara:strand:+ start:166 stop:1170 length:1005 start_codon:yes stop_codon:yes gene_type:complete
MDTKVCKKCGAEKPVFNFSKGGKQLRANGEWKQYYHTTCKQCVNRPRVRKDNVDPKVCNICCTSKSLSEYAYDAKRDRYRGDCKQCKYEQRKKHRAENPEVRERERERNRWRFNNVEGVRERAREVANKSRAKHKDRRNAEQRDRYANDPEYAEKQRQYRRDLWANNPEYREKSKKLNKIYREENKEELRIKQQKYIEENKDKIKETQQKRYYGNPEHMKKLRKANYEKHQEKLVEDQRRIRKERRQYLEEYLGGKCVKCGATERLDFDHIIPADKSYTIGSNITCFSLEELILEVDKCQLLCRPCHIQKGRENGDFTGPKGLPAEVKERRIKR